MDQLTGSLRFIPLTAVTQFVIGLGSTGRLKISQAGWSGEIWLHDGEIVGAQLGAERGRPALEGMVLGLTEANFAFVDGSVDGVEPLFSREQLGGYLAGLVAERERLELSRAALSSVPRLIDHADQDAAEAAHVTIQAAALQLVPSLVHGRTLEQIAQQRGLARTLREVAMLRAGGLVRLEPTTTPAVEVARLAPEAGTSPTPDPDTAAAPAPRTAPPRLLSDERPRLEAVANEADGGQAMNTADPGGNAAGRARSWRHALVGFFIAEPASQA
jgi:prepilin-type processing-associated H-X9-DG protein